MGIAIAVVVLLTIPFVIWRPYVGAIVYTILAYLRPQDLAGGDLPAGLRLSLIVLAATAAGIAIGWARGKERVSLPGAWLAIVTAMVATMLLSAQEAIDGHAAIAACLKFLQMLAGVGMTVALCGTPERLRGVLTTIALSIGLMAVWSLAFPVWDDGRLTGGGGKLADSNDFALALAMALPLLLFLRRHEPRRVLRYALAAAVPFVLVAIVLTYSRGGFLALSAVGLGWIFFSRGRLVRLLLAPVIALVFLALAPPSYLARLTTIENYGHDESALDRLSSWRVATRVVSARPWTGVGPGNFLAAYPRYSLDFQKPHVAHNAWLQLAADSGVVSAALFGALILVTSAGAIRAAVRSRAARRRAIAARAPPRASTWWWIDDCGAAVAISLLAFTVGAQFLSKDTFDLVYLLTGLAGVLTGLARADLAPREKVFLLRHVVPRGRVRAQPAQA